MDTILIKIKDLATVYLFLTITGVAMFSLFLDCKSLKKKKLKKEEKICKYMGYGWLIIELILFVATRME